MFQSNSEYNKSKKIAKSLQINVSPCESLEENSPEDSFVSENLTEFLKKIESFGEKEIDEGISKLKDTVDSMQLKLDKCVSTKDSFWSDSWTFVCLAKVCK